MGLHFESLADFVSARDFHKIDLSYYDDLLQGLDYGKLNAVLNGRVPFHIFAIKSWLKNLSRICGIKIKLKLNISQERPYMIENGELHLSIKDCNKPSYIFCAIAHESAHFILCTDENYQLLKKLDAEYEATENENNQSKEMRSPIEYCANLITLKILQRCLSVLRCDKLKGEVSSFICTLQQQTDGEDI